MSEQDGPRHRSAAPSTGTDPGYPRPQARRAARRKKATRWQKIRRSVYALIALAIIGPIVAFMVAYVVIKVPQPSDLKTNQVATVFTQDGKTQLARLVPPEGNRTDVTISDVPTHVRFAVLSAEDRTFYSNPGFSVSGTARAALNDVTGGDRQGGSTITQQYVKNALTGDDQTLTRKLKELVTSTKLARQTSKDDILAAYLNTIYFGRGSYGISAAAKTYFGKSTKDLTVAEGAVLAASIRSPSALDPTDHPEAAQQRWTYVLDGMVSQNWLAPNDRATQVYPKVLPPVDADVSTGTQGPNGLIVRQVKAELSASGVSEQQLATEGLQITTTIDPKAQQAAVEGAQKTLASQPKNLRSAVVSVDPRNGAVRAYYGGDVGTGLDYAQSTSLQPGSSFKVFELAAALKKGIPLSRTYDGSSPQTIDGQKISNADGESCGRCSLATALKMSLNTVFFQLTADIGPQVVADTAHAAGIPLEFPDGTKPLVNKDGSPPNAGIGLGQYEVRPIDMASAYATFATNGMQHDSYFVQKVVTSDGTVLLDRGAPAGKQTIDQAVAKNVTAAMEPIAGYSRSHNLAGGRESAAKTGTSQLGDTENNRDAWMVGYTPSLSTAVWVGTTDGGAIKSSGGSIIYGSGVPADIWKSAMDGALQGTPEETFPSAPAINGGSSGVPAETTYVAPRRTATYQPAPTATTRYQPAPTTTTDEPVLTTTEPPPATTTTEQPAPTTTAEAPTTTNAPRRTTPPRVTRPQTPPPMPCPVPGINLPPGCAPR